MDTVLVTPVAVVLLLMMMISTNTAQLTIEATRGGPGIENNNIRLTCRDSDTLNVTRAAYYRRDPQDGRDLLINSNASSVQFQIHKESEGLYFCNNSMGQSNIQPINGIIPSDVILLSDVILVQCNFILYYTEFAIRGVIFNGNTQPGVWGAPYTAVCPYKFGLLTQYYSITWRIRFSEGFDADIDTNTTEYQLIGSALRIATFTPFVKSLVCILTTTGVPPFLGTSRNKAAEVGLITKIEVERGERQSALYKIMSNYINSSRCYYHTASSGPYSSFGE